MLRDQLRLHTQVQHEHIEATLNLPDSIRNQDDYARLLGAFYGFYVPLETALLAHEAALSGVGVKLTGRRKAHKVRADLESLRVSDEAIDEIALCASPPVLPTWRHALGSLYVMEGSTLGGQVIALQLCRHLELPAALHLQFFSGYGAKTGTMWRAFVDSLNGVNLPVGDTADVLQGARETFEALDSWMAGRRS